MINLKTLWNKYGVYIISVAAALAVGAVSGFISGGSMEQYESLIKPPLSPPGWVFPVVWTALYIMMGIAAAIIWNSRHPDKDTAITAYAVQLAVNFFWTIFYFVFEARLLAFLWLVLLIALVFITIKYFCKISTLSGWLLLPYFTWLLYASYLNLGTYLLNR